MAKVNLKIKSTGQIIEAEKGRLEFSLGDWILIETKECKEVAIVVESEGVKEQKNAEDSEEHGIEVIRKLNKKDLEQYNEYKKLAQGLIPECQKKIEYHKLPMEVVDAELSFDEKKLTFYFSAEGRVDFRSLVSDLASTFKKLIRLQQIGPREEAKLLGGCGRCGQILCCKKFLKGDLDCATLDMAQIQGLAIMGQNRVTGCCGKLMCCLTYEIDNYKKVAEKLPKIGAKIKTEKGVGIVVSQNLLTGKVLAEVNDGTRLEAEC